MFKSNMKFKHKGFSIVPIFKKMICSLLINEHNQKPGHILANLGQFEDETPAKQHACSYGMQ